MGKRLLAGSMLLIAMLVAAVAGGTAGARSLNACTLVAPTTAALQQALGPADQPPAVDTGTRPQSCVLSGHIVSVSVFVYPKSQAANLKANIAELFPHVTLSTKHLGGLGSQGLLHYWAKATLKITDDAVTFSAGPRLVLVVDDISPKRAQLIAVSQAIYTKMCGVGGKLCKP